MQTSESFQQERDYLNIQEQTEASNRLHSRFIYMQCTSECMIGHVRTVKVNGEDVQH